jgi:hypothetical protein
MCAVPRSRLSGSHLSFLRFNIYIYDYCNKRGFHKTARELVAEADIHPESMPPINAKQGLLFECVCVIRVSAIVAHLAFRWWSVFWVLFTAKSNGNGTDEALLYTQVRPFILVFYTWMLKVGVLCSIRRSRPRNGKPNRECSPRSL